MNDHVARAICRTIGCTSPFGNWFQWPHRFICYYSSMPDEIRGERLMRRAKSYDLAAERHPWVAGLLWTHAIRLRKRGNKLLYKHYRLDEVKGHT